MQQKDYCREEKFLADEKHTLQPLPETAFEIKYYREHKVAKNNHIYLGMDKHYYSVPYTYIGMKVKVIYTRSLVRIYHKAGLIATHPRNHKKRVAIPPGKNTCVPTTSIIKNVAPLITYNADITTLKNFTGTWRPCSNRTNILSSFTKPVMAY